MADNTIIQQGKFTADGSVKILQIRSDMDWMRVYNWTQAATQQSTGRGVEFFWQRGMAADTGIEYKKTNSTDALNMVTLSSGGFSTIDTSVGQTVNALNTTVSAVSTASTPVVSASSTSGLSDGDVVRMISVSGAAQLGGIDFTIGSVVGSTSFTLAYMAQLGGAGTTGNFRKVNYDPIFYPRYRYITKLTQASSAVVTLSVTHGYTVGQVVKFIVPDAYGMVEMNNLTGSITAINTGTNTITVNIDSTAFTAFAFPATAAAPFSPAIIVPVGEDVTLPNLNDDGTYNTSYIGMKLAAGVQSPAGSASDVIYWTAGKSFSVTNE